jgi:hypothetical protein
MIAILGGLMSSSFLLNDLLMTSDKDCSNCVIYFKAAKLLVRLNILGISLIFCNNMLTI